MRMRIDGQVHERVTITRDNPQNEWEITAFGQDGTIAGVFHNRDELVKAGAGLLFASELEYSMLSRAGLMPPYKDND